MLVRDCDCSWHEIYGSPVKTVLFKKHRKSQAFAPPVAKGAKGTDSAPAYLELDVPDARRLQGWGGAPRWLRRADGGLLVGRPGPPPGGFASLEEA